MEVYIYIINVRGFIPIRDEHMEEDDGINIKPPQNQAGRKEKSHKHRHKEEKKRDKEHREYERYKDRMREGKDPGRSREAKDARGIQVVELKK